MNDRAVLYHMKLTKVLPASSFVPSDRKEHKIVVSFFPAIKKILGGKYQIHENQGRVTNAKGPSMEIMSSKGCSWKENKFFTFSV